MTTSKLIIYFFSALILLIAPLDASGASAALQTETTQQKAKKRTKKTAPQTKKKQTKKKKVSGSQNLSTTEMQQRQESAEQDIKQTRQQIQQNDKSIERSLSDLNRIDSEIVTSQQQITALGNQIGSLDKQISILSSQISANEMQLSTLRHNYLKTVKQMRLKRGKTNLLAFVFSSANFNQAFRRLRYLREFSKWRDDQVAAINNVQKTLKVQHNQLSRTKDNRNAALNKRVATNRNLQQQQNKQTALVAELRRNGDALRSHLAQKQSEANALRNQIANAIAQQQRLAEQRRREQEEREREQQRREQQAQQERQKQQQAQQQQAQQKPEKKINKKETEKPEPTTENRTYADARNRKRRENDSKNQSANIETTPTKPTITTTDKSGFSANKGSLPHPASGSFRIVSPFGRHSHPDLPGVEYDNPGIDAEVSNGAYAQAVYAGKITGIYVLQGFHTVIIVSHDDYYTVYGNIASPSVKVGQNVTSGQQLGKLFADPENNNRTTVHFEVWHNRNKLNPSEWIR